MWFIALLDLPLHSQGIVIIKILALVITVISRFVSVFIQTDWSFASRLNGQISAWLHANLLLHVLRNAMPSSRLKHTFAMTCLLRSPFPMLTPFVPRTIALVDPSTMNWTHLLLSMRNKSCFWAALTQLRLLDPPNAPGAICARLRDKDAGRARQKKPFSQWCGWLLGFTESSMIDLGALKQRLWCTMGVWNTLTQRKLWL